MADSRSTCPSCGAKIIEGIMSCPECGERIKSISSDEEDQSTNDEEKLSGTTLAKFLRYGFVALGGLALLSFFFRFVKQVAVQEILKESGQIEGIIENSIIATNLVFLVVWVPSVISFLIWFRKSYKNLEVLGVKTDSLDFSPGWAVGSFFIPIANFIWPYKAMKEIWFASDVNRKRVTAESIREEYSPKVMKAWWICWVIWSIGEIDIGTMDAPFPTFRYIAIGMWSIQQVIFIVAAFLLATVIHQVTERQKRNFKLTN